PARTADTYPGRVPSRPDTRTSPAPSSASLVVALRPYRHLLRQVSPMRGDGPQVSGDHGLRLPTCRHRVFVPDVWEKLRTVHIAQGAHAAPSRSSRSNSVGVFFWL